MYRIPAVLIAAELMALSVHAQTTPKFEVASIKRCQDSNKGGSGGEPTPGRLHLNCLTTANLIRMAYLVFPTGRPNEPVNPNAFFQPISGGPSWINSDLYRIDAKADWPANLEMMRGPMMQALLEGRFQLKIRRESKETNVFELTVGKSVAKLNTAKDGGCVAFDRNNPPPEPAPGEPKPVLCGSIRVNANGGFDIQGITIADLCRELTKYVERDIVDKTGIAGVFDVHLDLTPADLFYPGAAPDSVSTFTPGDGRAVAVAVEKLGLQMRPAKGSAPFLVIDRIERPSGN